MPGLVLGSLGMQDKAPKDCIRPSSPTDPLKGSTTVKVKGDHLKSFIID